MSDRRVIPWILPMLLLGVALVPEAQACGFCAGDRAAAVYSYKNKKLADRIGGRYVAVGIAGAEGEADFEDAARWLESASGVSKGTVKSAWAQKSVSLVLEKDVDLERISAAFAERFPGRQLTLLEQVN